MHTSLVNVGYQGKSGPGKIHEVILVISQVSVLLTYIKGRQMVAPKLLNIQFERHQVLFQLLVNTKMEKSGIRFGNRTGCQCNSTPGVKVMGYYPCVNSEMLHIFFLI